MQGNNPKNLSTMRKTFFLILAHLCFLPLGMMSQETDFETWRRQQEQQFEAFAEEREQALKALEEDFENFVEQRNREYAEYLKREWERRRVFEGEKRRPMPKPEEMPHYTPQPIDDPPVEEEREKSAKDVEEPVRERDISPVPFHEPLRLRPVEQEEQPLEPVTVDFYGRTFNFETAPSFRGLESGGVSEDDVSGWFQKASQAEFTPTLVQLLEKAGETGMNDWALLMAARKTAKQLVSDDPTAHTLYAWFMMVQAGYDVRLGRQDDRLILLAPFNHIVYNTPRLTLDDKTYYILDESTSGPVYTYDQPMEGAYRSLDMNFYQSPQLAASPATKTLEFPFGDDFYSVTLSYDPVLVKLLRDQPQADMNVYLDAVASNHLMQSTETFLENMFRYRDDVEQVNFLLTMTQIAFQYETDIEQFGYQRYMFPDEVMHYDKSDCDDRAVLFAWMVRNFTDQQVAAVLYPNHLANAVHFPEGNPAGDYLVIDNKPFVIADPTFINAPLGMTMPDLAHQTPQAWMVDPQGAIYELAERAWQQIFELGGRRGNRYNDLAKAPGGMIYVTGYFNKHFGDSGVSIQGQEDKRTAFVASFDENMDIQWAHPLESEGDATGFSLLLNPQGNLVVAGSFTQNLQAQGRRLQSSAGAPDAFVAAFSPRGQLRWLENAGLDTRHHNNALAYSFHLDMNGRPLATHYYNDPRERVAGLYLDGEYGVVLTGTFGNTSGLTMYRAPEVATAAEMSYADMLIHKNRELINQDVESSIAGLFAAIHLAKADGTVFPGTAAQEAINRGNPSFRRSFPETFANIGKINFLKNKSGVIEIRTQNGEDVYFDKMRIKDRSTVRIVTLPNNDERIDILSRIEVGQLFVWYRLNFIRLYSRTGDLLFDYRRNNSQSTMNLKNDILN